MRHKVAGVKLGRTTAHKKALFRNLVTSLIINDRIETTLPKAKELRRWADKMITLAKKNTVHARRQAMSLLQDRAALQKLFTTLVDRYKDRAGGYTRILKLGFRHGDNAAMAVIEYLTAEAKKAVKPSAAVKKTDVKAGKAPVKKAAAKTATKTKETKKKTSTEKKTKKKSETKKKSGK